MRFLCFLLTLLAGGLSPLQGNDLNKIDFASLPQVASGEEIKLRGFLYHDEKGSWILAEQPHLKSCCLKGHLGSNQVIVEGDLQTARVNHAISVKGILNRENGQYILRQAAIIPDKKNTFSAYLLLSALGLLTTFGVLYKKKLWNLFQR